MFASTYNLQKLRQLWKCVCQTSYTKVCHNLEEQPMDLIQGAFTERSSAISKLLQDEDCGSLQENLSRSLEICKKHSEALSATLTDRVYLAQQIYLPTGCRDAMPASLSLPQVCLNVELFSSTVTVSWQRS